MNNLKTNLTIAICLLAFMISCNNKPKEDYGWLKNSRDVSVAKLKLSAAEVANSDKMPRSIWVG